MEERHSKTLKFLSLIFCAIWIIKGMESFYLFSHGDALSYHIVWPELVLNHGIKKVLKDFNSIWLSGIFDSLYFLPHLLFSSKETAQRMSQFIHFFFSIGLASLLPLIFVKNRIKALIIGICILTISKSSDMFLYAKNDGFIALLSLFSYFVIHSKYKYKSELLGLCFGVAIATKLSAIFALIPLGIWFLYKNRKSSLVPVFKLIFISILIVFPIFYLKWIYKGNPFYPGFIKIFPGNMPEPVQNAWIQFMSTHASFSSIFLNLKVFFTGKILFLFALPLLILDKKKKEKELLYLSVSSMALYLFMNGGIVAPRFYFSCYFFLSVYCVSRFFDYSRLNKNIIYILFILIVIDSKIDKSLKRIKATVMSSKTRRELIPRSKVWDYVDENSRVLTFQFPEIYYSHKNIWLDSMRTDTKGYLYTQDCLPKDQYNYLIIPNGSSISGCLEKKMLESKNIKSVSGLSIYQLEAEQ